MVLSHLPPVSFGRDTEAGGPFYLVSMPGKVKYHTQGVNAYLYVETRPPVIWTGKNEYGRVEIWWTGKNNEGAKKGLPKP